MFPCSSGVILSGTVKPLCVGPIRVRAVHHSAVASVRRAIPQALHRRLRALERSSIHSLLVVVFFYNKCKN